MRFRTRQISQYLALSGTSSHFNDDVAASDEPNLIVIVSTKNEANNIAECLSSVLASGVSSSAVVVVDSNSTDGTPALAQAMGVEVVSFSWNGVYPKKKQWCLDNVRIDVPFVLFLDGDERLSSELFASVRKTFARGAAAVDVPICYVWQGTVLRHGYQVVKRIALDRRCTAFPLVDDLEAPGMGELEGHYQPAVAGSIARVSVLLRHDDQDSLSHWLKRHNGYSDWEAWVAQHPRVRAQVRASKTRNGAVFDRVPLKSAAFFVYCYLFRRGFLDGRAGLDYAVGLAFYRWQISAKVRYARGDG